MKGIGFYGEDGITFQDEDRHIIENVKRILTTRRGERMGDLSFGSDISKYFFMPDMHVDDVIDEIVNSIKRNEPRVIVKECSLTGIENGTVKIDLVLEEKATGRQVGTSIEI